MSLRREYEARLVNMADAYRALPQKMIDDGLLQGLVAVGQPVDLLCERMSEIFTEQLASAEGQLIVALQARLATSESETHMVSIRVAELEEQVSRQDSALSDAHRASSDMGALAAERRATAAAEQLKVQSALDHTEKRSEQLDGERKGWQVRSHILGDRYIVSSSR